MSFISSSSGNIPAILFRTLVFILSVFVVVLAFPEKPKFGYEYKNLTGKPWPYESLIADFDFVVKKPAAEIEKEKQEQLANFKPYYERKEEVHLRAKNKFRQLIDDALKKNSGSKAEPALRREAEKMLDSAYRRGILQQHDNLEGKPSGYTINLLENSVVTERPVGSFFTVRSCYDYFMNELYESRNQHTEEILSILRSCIEQNIIYDEATTRKMLQQALEEISPTKDVILKNQSIISRGELVTQEKYLVLDSFRDEYETQYHAGRKGTLMLRLSQVLLSSFCLIILVIFLYLFRKDEFQNNIRFFFIFFLIVSITMITGLLHDFTQAASYAIPFCLAPIIVRAFYDTRIALFVHLVLILLISLMIHDSGEFIFLQLCAGIMAIFSIANMKNRSQVFYTALIVFVSYLSCFLLLKLLQDQDPGNIDRSFMIKLSISAALTLFSYPLIFMFEKIFGFTSDVTLIELSSNTPLLRELASRAPGTFQHSLQVANLAEEAMYNIGGNALLARTGALYHDIGKMEMPGYFIENQVSGINPHHELSHEESASIIIGHVIKGIEKARSHNLPEQVIDFIRTHHGTTRTEYFYRMHLQEFPDDAPEDSIYRYPGPIPYSRETAVVMIADAVEATSRSLKEHTADALGAMVDATIDRLIAQDQFINADITFRDITRIRKTLKKKLVSIYHARIEYPESER